MHDRNLYEYAVIRYVPDVEREEFVNVGLLMMCKRRKWIRVCTALNNARIDSFGAHHGIDEIECQLRTFLSTVNGDPASGPIGELLVEERFRWLTAVKSACIQTSRPHPGMALNLDEEFERLFVKLVQ